MTHRTKVVALLITGASTLGLIAPQLAGAANRTYPSNQEARSFHTSDGGWHSGTSFGGLCIPAVNCPTVTNDYVASEGAGGSSDGYLRTQIGALLGVGATSRGIYQSPAFTYSGVGGGQPDKLTLSVARRSTLATLLAVSGNSAEYSVDLVDTSQGGAATSVIDQRPIGDQNSWRTSSASVSPGSLTLGDRYRVRITSEFETGIQVVPGGSVGYDNVVLEGTKKPTGGGPGGPGGPGNGGGGSIKHIRHQITHGLGPAIKKGKHLIVKVKCPRSVGSRKCHMKVAAKLNRHGPKVTNVRKSHLGGGKSRRIRFKMKHGYAKKVAHREHVVLKERVRIGHHRFTVTKRVRVVRH
ncbi:MAG TPA: hypothetical protein VH391_08910 [Solirubrobacterales bacterium]|jgi:hypothetical protein